MLWEAKVETLSRMAGMILMLKKPSSCVDNKRRRKSSSRTILLRQLPPDLDFLVRRVCRVKSDVSTDQTPTTLLDRRIIACRVAKDCAVIADFSDAVELVNVEPPRPAWQIELDRLMMVAHLESQISRAEPDDDMLPVYRRQLLLCGNI